MKEDVDDLTNKSSYQLHRLLHLPLQRERKFLIPFSNAHHLLIFGNVFCGDQWQMNLHHIFNQDQTQTYFGSQFCFFQIVQHKRHVGERLNRKETMGG